MTSTARATAEQPAVLAASTVLAGARRARRARREADLAEARVLASAAEWAALHEVPLSQGATWGETPVLLAGEGAPAVGEFCIAEFAAALRISTEAGRMLIADALELAHRFPRLWGRVQDGTVQAWRARRIATRTTALTMQAAAFVDDQVAGLAHRVSTTEFDRLVETAIHRYMPEEAEARADQAHDPRRVQINTDAAFSGLASLEATMDLVDGIDMEKALQAGAAHLAALGSTDSLDVRRSIALGELARGDLTLPGATDPVTLHIHLAPGSDVAVLENAGKNLLTEDQVRTWCGTAARIIVKPVIDLHDTLTTDAYAVPDKLREHVVLRDRTCVFPYCERNARACDADHIEPYDPDGPPGQTSTENLAPACRGHHRLKTHGGWTYVMVEPGVYLWRSPHGYQFLRDGSGTRDLTPRPVDPPGTTD